MITVVNRNPVEPDEKFRLMQRDAQYDIASSMEVLSSDPGEINRSIRAPKAPPKVPKVFLSNECAFNCAYCGCRSGNDCKRAYQTTPTELAEFSVRVAREFQRGIFISSAIFRTPDYTAELINETLRIIRRVHGYRGYLHAKVMPGTSTELIEAAGQYADRLSVNIEVAKSEGYARVAKNKNRRNILTPMGQISRLIREARLERAPGAPAFATSQTTQLMVGSAEEDDRTILDLSAALYRKYGLSRVYYTPFDFRGAAVGYDLAPVQTPPWRVHRLYQADRLLQQYGFTAGELAPDSGRSLRRELDPKLAWALRNYHLFPIELNTADYEMLLRVPGIGTTYARRILEARRQYHITHDILKQLGVSLRKARHFVTCNGKYTGNLSGDPAALYALLADPPTGYEGTQLTLDMGLVRRPAMMSPLHA